MEEKTRIRAEMLKIRGALPPGRLLEWSEAIAARFFETALYREAEALLLYVSKAGEVSTEKIFARAWADGKETAVPLVTGEGLVFSRIRSISELAPGHFGVREPLAIHPIEGDPAKLVVLPGLAFDGEGRRLGYGKGYYDRYLSQNPGLRTAALAFDFSVLPALPEEETDIRAGCIVTESRVIAIRQSVGSRAGCRCSAD